MPAGGQAVAGHVGEVALAREEGERVDRVCGALDPYSSALITPQLVVIVAM